MPTDPPMDAGCGMHILSNAFSGAPLGMWRVSLGSFGQWVAQTYAMQGPAGRGVHTFQQASEPLTAQPGDVWFIP